MHVLGEAFPSKPTVRKQFCGLPELFRWKRNIKQAHIKKSLMIFVNCGMNTFISNYCQFVLIFQYFVFILKA